MAEEPESQSDDSARAADFSREIGRKERRKLRSQRRKRNDLWAGFRMMGIVGWSVAVPTLLGIALGIWIDTHYHGHYSWTLMLLLVGLVLGCYNAWYWVAREGEAIRRELEENHDTDRNA